MKVTDWFDGGKGEAPIPPAPTASTSTKRKRTDSPPSVPKPRPITRKPSSNRQEAQKADFKGKGKARQVEPAVSEDIIEISSDEDEVVADVKRRKV